MEGFQPIISQSLWLLSQHLTSLAAGIKPADASPCCSVNASALSLAPPDIQGQLTFPMHLTPIYDADDLGMRPLLADASDVPVKTK